MATQTPVFDGRLSAIGWAELRFRAMGTHVHLAVLGEDPTALIEGRRRVDELEQRWSRFRPDSLLCRLNEAGGRPVVVDQETFDLVAAAVTAWHRTGHHFDPTVLDALEAAGYDRSFDQLGQGPATVRMPPSVPGCAGIGLEPDLQRVSLPPGTRLDLGGIGKGRAADLVAGDLLAAGARSVLVNLGGDLRIAGEPPAHGAFSIVVEDPNDLTTRSTIVDLGHGALATSSRARRCWTRDGTAMHHLIDPSTAAPADTDVAAVTVVADEATTAEVLAKAALVAGLGPGRSLLADAGVAALLVGTDGTRLRSRDFGRYER